MVLLNGWITGVGKWLDLIGEYRKDRSLVALDSSLYLDYRSIRSDSSRLIIEGGIWKPCSSLGFLPAT